MSNSISSVTSHNSLICTCNESNNLSRTIDNSFESVVSTKSEQSYSQLVYGVANIPTGNLNNMALNSNMYSSLGNSVSSSASINLGTSSRVEVSVSNLTEKEKIEDAISIASKKYGVDDNLIRAVIKTESNFKSGAVSSAGAKGLMQIMPANYSYLGIKDPFDVYQNVDGGTKLLKEYIDKYNGDVEMALMAYNGGPTRMKNRGVTSVEHIYKMPKETQNYVKKVMNYYRGV